MPKFESLNQISELISKFKSIVLRLNLENDLSNLSHLNLTGALQKNIFRGLIAYGIVQRFEHATISDLIMLITNHLRDPINYPLYSFDAQQMILLLECLSNYNKEGNSQYQNVMIDSSHEFSNFPRMALKDTIESNPELLKDENKISLLFLDKKTYNLLSDMEIRTIADLSHAIIFNVLDSLDLITIDLLKRKLRNYKSDES